MKKIFQIWNSDKSKFVRKNLNNSKKGVLLLAINAMLLVI